MQCFPHILLTLNNSVSLQTNRHSHKAVNKVTEEKSDQNREIVDKKKCVVMFGLPEQMPIRQIREEKGKILAKEIVE